MAVSLHIGLDGVSYQPASVKSPADFPRHKVNLATGTSIPRHVEKVFNLYANERSMADAITPVLSNPYVTTPARYLKLFGEIETASASQPVERGETGRILTSARTLLATMKEDFAAFASARNVLIGI